MDSSLLKEVQQGSGERTDGSRRNQFGKEEASAGRRASTQRALGCMQTGSSGGAGHGRGLAQIQCGWSRVYRAATSDMEAGT